MRPGLGHVKKALLRTEAAGQKANAGAPAQNGGNGVLEEVTSLLNADPPSWPWILAAFGILAVGTIISYVVWRSVKPTDFMPSSNYAVYAALFVMALALERVLEPFSGLFIPSVKAKKAQSTAMAAHAKRAQVAAATGQLDAAVADPAAARRAQETLRAAAAAQKDAAVAQKEHHHSQANRAVLMWATAAVLAMLACASLGIFLLRSIETPGAVTGSTASASVRSSSAAPSAPSPAKNPNRRSYSACVRSQMILPGLR
jgi:hypothetical protein